MEYTSSPQRLYQTVLSREKNSSPSSLAFHINKSDFVTPFASDCTYRTEAYLQERERQNMITLSLSSPLPSVSTTTTWKKLKYQKQSLDNDQAEIDRILSVFDSIHKTFNRSLIKPYAEIYSSFYGDEDSKSDHLMKTFCQCQNHCTNQQDDGTSMQETLSKSFLHFDETDTDLDDIEDKKKNSYDSGYGSVMARRNISRESFNKISKHLNTFNLIPIDVDFHTEKNMEEHSTKHYDIPGLVLRRGQPFSFTVTFNKDYDFEQQELYVRLTTGSCSMISKHTQIRLLVNGTTHTNGWSAKSLPIKSNDMQKKNNRISLQIDSPSDAIIGKYSLLLEVRPRKKEEKILPTKSDFALFLFEVDIYFLFNPWKKDDACALSSEEQINEYVMNEHGQIYLGSQDKPHAIPWYFGQFERSTLLTALTLLDKTQLPPQNRIDPSIVLRIISSKICSNPGTNSGIFPSAFDCKTFSSEKNVYTSSTSILQQYLSSNGQSVQGGSGTNWQHAAILCSLSRALGIPCRIVTIYNAALQMDGTNNNDIHWDTKQRPLKQLNSDLICSSHVWNECWMRRNDLPNREQDWQIVDATPVQMCDGIRRTGPCSVSRLKTGDVSLRWDSPFIHSTVNGNKSHWFVYPDGNMELLDVQEHIVGNKIITRSLNNEFEPEILTHNYKNLMKSLDTNSNLIKRTVNDVDLELNISDDVKFGDNIILQLNVKNKSKEMRTIANALSISIITSNTKRLVSYWDQPIQLSSIDAGKNETIRLNIRPEQYMNYGCAENIIVRYYLYSRIKETSQTFTRDDNIVFSRDDLIELTLTEDVIESDKPILLDVQITNKLLRRINNGHIHIDGLGINQIISTNRSFAPKEAAKFNVKLNPKRIGVGRLYVTFISDDVCSLTQTISLEIVDGPIPIPKEPLLKANVQSLAKQNEIPEIKIEENKVIFQSNISNEEKRLASNEDQRPLTASSSSSSSSSLSTIQGEHQDTKMLDSLKYKHESSSTINDDDDELDFERKQSRLSRNNESNLSLRYSSTLSLDKDKISIDSLDTAHEHRNVSKESDH